MEVMEEYIKSRISSLVEKMKLFDEERKSILLEVKSLKNTAKNSGASGIFQKTLGNLEDKLENLVVTVQDCDKRETEREKTQLKKRKCRYFNRGFCKYKERCKFYHSPVICKEYLEEGMCKKVACSQRHPKVCKYWSGRPEGCRRDDSCQYLHQSTGNIKMHESPTPHCDDCGMEQDEMNYLKTRIDASHECELNNGNQAGQESEENYLVTREAEGKIQFNCRLCEATFASQKSMKEHITANHEVYVDVALHQEEEIEEIYVVTKSNNGKIEFVCKLCEATFGTQKSVKQHGTKEHECFY